MKLDVDFSELHQAVAKMVPEHTIPEPTIHDLHSTVLETFMVAIEKQMDFEEANRNTNNDVAEGILTGLQALLNNVAATQAAAIERETGA